MGVAVPINPQEALPFPKPHFSRLLLIGILCLGLTLPSIGHAQMAQQAQTTSANHYAQAQQALLMAFYFFDKCQKGDKGACLLAGLCLNQYNELMKSGTQSQTTAELSSTTGENKKAVGTVTNGATVNGMTVRDMVRGLEAKGLALKPDGTASLNGGPSVPLNGSLATESGLAAAGLGPQQIAQTRASMDEVKDKLGSNTKAAVDFGVGSSSGFSSRAAPESPAGGSEAPKANHSAKANVSGLSKNLGNDKIGVAGDDIFAMITRRYKANEKDLKE